MRIRWFAVPAALAFVSLLAACTGSVSAGVSGIVLAVVSTLAILASGAASSGCDCGYRVHDDDDDTFTACLDVGPEPDADVGPCLSVEEPDADVGPCLEAPYDAGFEACLSMVEPDAGVQACLDVEPCLGAPAEDAGVEPCLTFNPEPDASVSTREEDRAAARDKFAARLPADVVARLRGRS
jgi:hypothetical protein